MKALTQVFRVIRYDARPRKSSAPPAPTPWSVPAATSRDPDDLNIEKVHWCGCRWRHDGQWLEPTRLSNGRSFFCQHIALLSISGGSHVSQAAEQWTRAALH